MHLETVYRWMNVLGFKYEPRKKHFYVDSHNKPEVLAYRDNDWSPRYFEREYRMHRWIQLRSDEVQHLIDAGEIAESKGFHFKIDGIPYIKYHVNDNPSFLDLGSKAHVFGGNLSVPMPRGLLPILLFGQDKALFRNFLTWWKA